MEKFKSGDRVKKVRNQGGHEHCCPVGTIGVFRASSNDIVFSNGAMQDICDGFNDWELISNKNMSIKDKFVTAFLKEPEKSFRKKGITNGDGFLTEDGEKVFLGWLLSKNGDAFKTEVVDQLEEDEVKS